MPDLAIDISKPMAQFRNHLKLEDNDRIIFSGQFGIGKTTFLKQFKKDNDQLYNVFHLYPVNYSVSSNEDIFELIKYDIFYELIKYDLDVQGAYSKSDVLPFFIQNKFYEILKGFVESVPKVGKSTIDILDKLTKLKSGFDKFYSKSNKNELSEIQSFVDSMSIKVGSIYEHDFYSTLISNQLEHIKKKEEDAKKENILVIDDLDRVDPEHVFRLLNVFAAHVDFDKETTNKYGFDKIVLVMDINNVHRIFANKYGQNVDFSGYIDKFFSREVYYFDNYKAIEKELEAILSSMNSASEELNFQDSHHYVRSELLFLLRAFFEVGVLNLRSLQKVFGRTYEPKSYDLYMQNSAYPQISRNYVISYVIDLAIFVLGSVEALRIAIDKCMNYSDELWIEDKEDKTWKEKISFLLVILASRSHDYSGGHDQNYEHKYLFNGVVLNYSLRRVGRSYSVEFLSGKYEDGIDKALTPKFYFALLAETLSEFMRIKG